MTGIDVVFLLAALVGILDFVFRHGAFFKKALRCGRSGVLSRDAQLPEMPDFVVRRIPQNI